MILKADMTPEALLQGEEQSPTTQLAALLVN